MVSGPEGALMGFVRVYVPRGAAAESQLLSTSLPLVHVRDLTPYTASTLSTISPPEPEQQDKSN